MGASIIRKRTFTSTRADPYTLRAHLLLKDRGEVEEVEALGDECSCAPAVGHHLRFHLNRVLRPEVPRGLSDIEDADDAQVAACSPCDGYTVAALNLLEGCHIRVEGCGEQNPEHCF